MLLEFIQKVRQYPDRHLYVPLPEVTGVNWSISNDPYKKEVQLKVNFDLTLNDPIIVSVHNEDFNGIDVINLFQMLWNKLRSVEDSVCKQNLMNLISGVLTAPVEESSFVKALRELELDMNLDNAQLVIDEARKAGLL